MATLFALQSIAADIEMGDIIVRGNITNAQSVSMVRLLIGTASITNVAGAGTSSVSNSAILASTLYVEDAIGARGGSSGAGGQWASNTASITVSATNRVGIGTNAPSYMLHANQPGTPVANQIVFGVTKGNGTTLLTLDEDGDAVINGTFDMDGQQLTMTPASGFALATINSPTDGALQIDKGATTREGSVRFLLNAVPDMKILSPDSDYWTGAHGTNNILIGGGTLTSSNQIGLLVHCSPVGASGLTNGSVSISKHTFGEYELDVGGDVNIDDSLYVRNNITFSNAQYWTAESINTSTQRVILTHISGGAIITNITDLGN